MECSTSIRHGGTGNYIWEVISLDDGHFFLQFLSCNAKISKDMTQLDACQFRHGLGLKVGHEDIFDWLNRFLRYP